MGVLVNRFCALLLSILFFLKTFTIGFYSLSIYPRQYQIEENISVMAKPTWYLWVSGLTNIGACLAAFWVFAGVCERNPEFFIPGFMGMILYIILDIIADFIIFFINDPINLLMTINATSTAFIAISLYYLYKYYKLFYKEDTQPQRKIRIQR